ncbi:sll0787 family AIR synthase-like protein [Paroceanicella profunda]|uniref:Sll0787 family AIR synthase-like protein n=1 Tax=Paroceanicella profunda TaxID=2579971 RepID=A0A5B8FHC8_9RHOB|nr:sll0787 family AIR synthase-like protein [Paroceanicella profunda]QDL92281.1 sll0787 family AIR synthase-like protein [Paroceanicella profunda]
MSGAGPRPAPAAAGPEGLAALAGALRAHPSIRGKRAIAAATAELGLGAASAGQPGDDAAVLPRPGGGYDLLAGEGFIPAFVADDPWFAGWCGVMVNLSDIAAMGGRAVALIDQVWAPSAEAAAPMMAGLRAAAEAYGVPVVGGHTNYAGRELSLAVSVFGRAEALISGAAARPGETLIAAVDLRGAYRPSFDNFCAALDVAPERLRADLALLPELAEAGLVRAGKDISQGGIAGTALMLAECSGAGIDIDLDALVLPGGTDPERWLRSFPSFGFLLTARPQDAAAVCARFAARDISATVIGTVTPGSAVTFRSGGAAALFWDHAATPYLGLAPKEPSHA